MANKLGKGWTMARWREFYDLRRMLNEIESLNSGNCHLEKTAKCIKEAKRFTNCRLTGKYRKCFMQFIEDLAIVKTEQ